MSVYVVEDGADACVWVGRKVTVSASNKMVEMGHVGKAIPNWRLKG